MLEHGKKLTDGQVIGFRERYRAGEMTARQIMIAAQVSMNTVRRMLNGETYGHIGRETPKEQGPIGDEEIARSQERFLKLLEEQEEAKRRAETPPEGMSAAGRARFERLVKREVGRGGPLTDEAMAGLKRKQEGEAGGPDVLGGLTAEPEEMPPNPLEE